MDKYFRNICWRIKEPYYHISSYDEECSIEDILNTPIPINKNSKAVILSHNDIPFLTERIVRNTVGSVLRSFERGLNKILLPGNRGFCGIDPFVVGPYYFEENNTFLKNSIVYSKIAIFYDSCERLKLVQDYETGKLKPSALFGKHASFRGVRKKGNFLFPIYEV